MEWGEKDTNDFYKGQVKWGKPNGLGILRMFGGTKYVGEFKDGEKHGEGTLIHPDGLRYEGEWKDGGFWNGTEYDKKGNIILRYVNGLRQ